MSAYLVEDRTINTIVNWMYRELQENTYFKEEVEKLGYGLDNLEKLAQDMFRLNIKSLNQRYGSAEGFRDLHFIYRVTLPVSNIQVLKSLQCWLYQCMEGNVVRKKLFRFFNEVIKVDLMNSIIYELPEYDKARWG